MCRPVDEDDPAPEELAVLFPVRILKTTDEPVPADSMPYLALVIVPEELSVPCPDPVAVLEKNLIPKDVLPEAADPVALLGEICKPVASPDVEPKPDPEAVLPVVLNPVADWVDEPEPEAVLNSISL